MSETDLIGSAEAAALLDVSRPTLWRWKHDGRITPAMVVPAGGGGADLYRRSDVEKLAAERAGSAA